MAPGEQPLDVGGRLLDLGCRQGAIIDAPAHLSWLRRGDRAWERGDEPLPDAKFVVASQDCDIKAPETAEPFVEALVVTRVTDRGRLHQARKGNSARRFLLAMDGPSGLVADACRRALIEKRSLLTATFAPAAPTGGAPPRPRFADWLAGRYSRPALPQRLVEAVQKPIVRAIEKADARTKRRLEGIDELLFRASGGEVALVVEFVLLTDRAELDPEDAAEVAGWLDEVIADSGLVSEIRVAFRTPATLSLQDYTELTRLDLDYFSEG